MQKSREHYGKLAGCVGLLCNSLLFGGKLLAGILSGSVAVIADAVNSLSDAASSVVTLIGFRLAGRPPDREHPYGHARAEYLSGLAVAALILLVGAELIKSSVERILHPAAPEFSILTLCILLASVLVKLWLFGFCRTLGKRIGSAALTASAADYRNDVLATSAVLAGSLCSRFFGWKIDGWLGLFIALFILASGIGIARDTISPLLGGQADKTLVSRISALLLAEDKILGFHDLMVHDYGPGQCFASVHAEMDAANSALACHEVLDRVEREALRDLNVHLVIHCDPVVTDDAEQNRLRTLVQEELRQIDASLCVHDFRISHGEALPRLRFDLAVPFSLRNRETEVLERVKACVHRVLPECEIEVTLDEI